MKTTIQGFVGEYNDCWLFETDKTSYNENVVTAIDDITGCLTEDGDEFRITIEFLGNCHDPIHQLPKDKSGRIIIGSRNRNKE